MQHFKKSRIFRKKLKLFGKKLKDFGFKTQRYGSSPLQLTTKKILKRQGWSKRLKTIPWCQWRCVDVEWRRLRWRPTFHDEPLCREAFPPIRCPLAAGRVSTWGEGAALTAGIAGAPCWRQTLWWHCQVPWLEPLEVREPRRQTLAFEDTLGTSVHKVDRLAYVLLVSKVVSCLLQSTLHPMQKCKISIQ